MAYLCVDKNGQEKIFNDKPYRDGLYYPYDESRWIIPDYYGVDDYGVDLPKGTINKLIDHVITWEDEPVAFK